MLKEWASNPLFQPPIHPIAALSGRRGASGVYAKIGAIYPTIPRSVAFVDASQEHVPLALYNRSHPAVTLLDRIAQSLTVL
jgi:chromosome partitioning protein